MDVRKLQEAVKELEAEAAKCLTLASKIKAEIKNALNGSTSPEDVTGKRHLKLRSKGKKKSYLTLAVDVLRDERRPMHVDEVVEKVAEQRADTTRTHIEGALVRGMATGKWGIKRTKPGTYAVTQ